MPYTSLNELPKGVKGNLPKHAQEIYKAAFNKAWQEYKDPQKRYKDTGHEETAHKVAWAAVEAKYHKDKDGKWKQN